MGGMFGESKFDILRTLPSAVTPRSIFVQFPSSSQTVSQLMREHGMQFPLILKPDIGERGFMVRRVDCVDDIERYVEEIKVNFIIQDFVNLPLEFGVFYHRHPSQSEGEVVSIVGKEMLFVLGDGLSTLEELIHGNDRAQLQWEKLKIKFAADLKDIPPKGKRIELVSIGNHALGTKFLNCNQLITPELSRSFDGISRQIPGFYFGRFDLRCSSLEDLQKGKVMVMELNGCGAEPAHIYDPSFKILDAVAVLFRHWKTIFKISRENHRRGVPYVSIQEGLAYYKKFKAATKL